MIRRCSQGGALQKNARALVPSMVFASALFVASTWFVTSCASNEAAPTGGEDAGTDAITPNDAGDASDASCEDGAASCERVLSCDEAEWCPTNAAFDTRNGLAAVWGSSASDVWAVGAQGTVLHFDGAAWKTTPAETLQSLNSVWGSGPNDVWIVSTQDVIFHGSGFVDGKATWSPVTKIGEPGVSEVPLLRAVWGTSPDDVWVGGDSSFPWFVGESLWRGAHGDGGTEWSLVNCAISIRALWGSSAADIWAVGSDGKAFHGTRTGPGEEQTWSEFDSQSTTALNAIWGSGPDDIWIAGNVGTIRHVTAGGSRVEIVPSPVRENLYGIWGTGPKDVWVVGDRGTLLHYDGEAFEGSTVALPRKELSRLYGVWGSGTNDVWAVGGGVPLHYSGPKEKARGDSE